MMWRHFGSGNLNYNLAFLPHVGYSDMDILLRAKCIQESKLSYERERQKLVFLFGEEPDSFNCGLSYIPGLKSLVVCTGISKSIA